MRKSPATILVLVALAACGEADSQGLADRMTRPLFVDTVTNPDATPRSYLLDAGRSAVFVFDGERRDYVAARSANPGGHIALPVGTHRTLRTRDVLYTGFAVTATGSSLAALYGHGFEARESHLTVVPLEPFPVDPRGNLAFSLPANAVGPFATPEGRFLVVNPRTPTSAEWRLYPEPVSRFAGPNARRVKWNRKGDRIYVADAVNRSVKVLAWPSMAPLAETGTAGPPIDLALHPRTEQLAVVTSQSLTLYGSLPTLPAGPTVPQSGLPLRVLYDVNENGAVLAVLNQNTTLGFYETETLCGIDVDAGGFGVANLRFVDEGEFSNPEIGEFSAVGCRSDALNQAWQVAFEGVVAEGRAIVDGPSVLRRSGLPADRIRAGDALQVAGLPSSVTAVTDSLLFFAPVTAPLEVGAPVTFTVRASREWTVNGSLAGFRGRVPTGEAFADSIAFVITSGGSEPTRGDQFIFESRNNVTQILVGGAPSDLSQDVHGRFLVAVPDNGHVRAVNVKPDDDQWLIQILYTIP